jgi:BirA family biotin operon repressor/biotin-[acetyl-CoA-carboxylase] ligase
MAASRVELPSGCLIHFDSLASTQDEARARLLAGENGLVGVRAGFQSAGRGRRGAEWFAPPGECLLVSYVVRNPPDPRMLALAAGLAVAESVEAVSGLIAGLKWPNDVLLGGRKTAGVLIETCRGAALVGIGWNVNVAAFPRSLDGIATSMRIETGQETSLDSAEAEVRGRLFDAASIAKLRPKEILDAWRARDHSIGRRYRVEPDGPEGVAAGIADTGELLLRLDTGETIAVLAATTR